MTSATRPDDLRLALCMRGGVSLAVWMGGVCAEVVALREAAGEKAGPRRALLDLAGYRTVTVDVLAGTSAGGLNGALMAAYLGHGLDFSRVRDVWLRLGDLEALARHPRDGQPPSLLKGDAGFYVKLRQAMRTLGAQAEGHAQAAAFTLLLTTTRLHAPPQHLFPWSGAPLSTPRGRAHFLFTHRPRRDSGGSPSAGAADVVDQLAYAARCTSSFPFAFEPGRAHVHGDVDADTCRCSPDLRGVSSETGLPDGDAAKVVDPWAVQVADGGLLDNVPVAWAVRAIASARATEPVDRWLLYLQPVPPQIDPRRDPGPTDVVPSSPPALLRPVRLLRSALGAKTQETLAEDIDELGRAQAESDRRAAGYGELLPHDVDALRALADDGLEDYRTLAGRSEARRLQLLLTEPTAVTGPDPLPFDSCQQPLRRLLSDDDGAAATDYLRGLAAGAAELVAPAEVDVPGLVRKGRTPLALARAIELCLDWVRADEVTAGRQATGASAQREALYDLRHAVEALLAVRDRLVLAAVATPAADAPADALADVRRATVALDRWLRAGGWRLGAAEGHRLPVDWAGWAEDVETGWRSALEHLPGTATDPWPTGMYRPLWQAVVRAARAVGRSVEAEDRLVAMRVAACGPAARAERLTEVLACHEVLLAPLRGDPLSEPTPLRFLVASAAGGSPVATDHGELLPSGPDKLAGNQFANFASFLSIRWRLNDWIWGRLDGASALSRVIAERLADRAAGSDDDVARTLHDYFTAPLDEHWDAHLAQRWKTYERRDRSWLRENAAEPLRERLHWEILREEVPLLGELDPGKDTPEGLQDGLDRAAARPPTTVAEVAAYSQVLADIGRERVRDLVGRWELRRTAVRLGLVGWRVLQPAGRTGTAVSCLLLTPLKPLAVAALLAFLAPVTAAVSSVLAWATLLHLTGQHWSWPALGPLATLTIALSTVLRRKAGWGSGPSLAVAGVAAVALAVLPLLVDAGTLTDWSAWPTGDLLGTVRRAWVVTAGGAAATSLASLWWLPGHRPSPGWWRRAGLLVGTAGLTAVTVLAWLALSGAQDGAVSGWRAAGCLYAATAVVSVVLTYAYPAAPSSRRGIRLNPDRCCDY